MAQLSVAPADEQVSLELAIATFVRVLSVSVKCTAEALRESKGAQDRSAKLEEDGVSILMGKAVDIRSNGNAYASYFLTAFELFKSIEGLVRLHNGKVSFWDWVMRIATPSLQFDLACIVLSVRGSLATRNLLHFLKEPKEPRLKDNNIKETADTVKVIRGQLQTAEAGTSEGDRLAALDLLSVELSIVVLEVIGYRPLRVVGKLLRSCGIPPKLSAGCPQQFLAKVPLVAKTLAVVLEGGENLAIPLLKRSSTATNKEIAARTGRTEAQIVSATIASRFKPDTYALLLAPPAFSKRNLARLGQGDTEASRTSAYIRGSLHAVDHSTEGATTIIRTPLSMPSIDHLSSSVLAITTPGDGSYEDAEKTNLVSRKDALTTLGTLSDARAALMGIKR